MRIILGAAFAIAAIALTAAHSPAPTPAPRSAILAEFSSQVRALGLSLDAIGQNVSESNFRASRTAFKRAETLLEFYAPVLTRNLNGPSPDADPDLPPIPPGTPSAFDRLYAVLNQHGAASQAKSQAASMAGAVRSFERNIPLLKITDSALFDAARLELARISTLGLAGFDAPNHEDALREEAAAFDGLRALFATSAGTSVIAPLANSAAALRTGADFEHFNRLQFIVRRANVAARAIAAARSKAGIGDPQLRRAWRAKAATVFDSNAFDAFAFAPEFASKGTPALVALGRSLFFDPRLSGPSTRSCATCHDPARAFADGMARPATLEAAQRATARNTPTVVNAALQPLLFADQRAGSLEEQIARVISSDAEMHSSLELAGERLHLTPLNVRIALAAYLRTLVALDSRADRALRGDTLALSGAERHGFDVYMGKARCGTCHFLPLTGGTVPPVFDESELEIVGAPQRDVSHDATIDADSGRERVDHAIEHRFAFRVPSLRNVALTAPYMHNGAFATLESVIDFYDHSGGRGVGAIVPGQTLPNVRLNLTATEKRDLAAFLRALTDSTPMVREREMQRRPR